MPTNSSYRLYEATTCKRCVCSSSQIQVAPKMIIKMILAGFSMDPKTRCGDRTAQNEENKSLIKVICIDSCLCGLSPLRWAETTSSHAVSGRAAGPEASLRTDGWPREIRKEGVSFVYLRPSRRHATTPAVHDLSFAALLPR